MLITLLMIKSYRSKQLKAFATKGETRKLPVQGDASIARLTRQLTALDVAAEPTDMDLPGWFFHNLQGGRHSVRVTANFRLTFEWETPDAIAVDLEDYH